MVASRAVLAPFGSGALYAKERLLRSSLPFLYGGDMIAEGHDRRGARVS
jgi:selenocysteine lyase/cysteine desulfurase